MNHFITLIVVALISTCAADWAFVGNASSLITVAQPVYSFTSVCTLSTTPLTGYNQFQINVTAESFYYVSLLAEDDARTYMRIQVYRGNYNPTSPCANLTYLFESGSVPHVNSLEIFAVGIYTFVVTTDSSLTSALFSIHIDKANLTTSTSDNGRWWNLPSLSSDGTCSNLSYSGIPAFYTWSPSVSGLYDISVYFEIESSSWQVAALYNNTPAFLNVFANTSDTAPSGCTDSLMAEKDSEFSYSNISARIVQWFGVQLNAGINYTLVASAYTAVAGEYGFSVRPSTAVTLSTLANFNRPEYESVAEGENCTEYSSSSTYVWATYPIFVSQSSVYVVDCKDFVSSTDLSGALYAGLNLGSVNSAPATCTPGWIAAADISGSGSLSTATAQIGTNLTFVAFPYYTGDSYARRQVVVYAYSGIPLPGTIPVVPTGSASTSTSTSTGGSDSGSDAAQISVGVILAFILALIA